jgi:glycosyltransferase involved in cell wall biosynthesis
VKILAIYRHYWPDATPYAHILRLILERFAQQGHDVTVCTAQPGYNDILHQRQPWRDHFGGVNVRRVPLLPERKRFPLLRAVNFCWFLLSAVFHAVLFRRYDLIVANSHPPILMGCALRIIRRLAGTPYIFHCQDIHPEADACAGGNMGRAASRFLRRVDSASCRDAFQVVVLSRDMAESLASRDPSLENVAIINNPPLAVPASTDPTLPGVFRDEPHVARLLFAGNLGRFQGLDRLIDAARLMADKMPFRLIFMGEGSAKAELQRRAGDLLEKNIVFLPHQPIETALEAMRASDYGLVSLLPDMCRYAFPSKWMTYLSVGCPVVAVVERQSELAETLESHQLGYVSPSLSPQDIAAVLTEAIADRSRWTSARRQEIAQACDRLYGQQRMLAAWDQLLVQAVAWKTNHSKWTGRHAASQAPADEAAAIARCA